MDGGGQCTLGVWAEIYGNTRFTSEVLLNAMNEGLSAERNVYLYSALNAYTDRYIHPSYRITTMRPPPACHIKTSPNQRMLIYIPLAIDRNAAYFPSFFSMYSTSCSMVHTLSPHLLPNSKHSSRLIISPSSSFTSSHIETA